MDSVPVISRSKVTLYLLQIHLEGALGDLSSHNLNTDCFAHELRHILDLPNKVLKGLPFLPQRPLGWHLRLIPSPSSCYLDCIVAISLALLSQIPILATIRFIEPSVALLVRYLGWNVWLEWLSILAAMGHKAVLNMLCSHSKISIIGLTLTF